jgi:hypothetical protein
VIGTSIEFQIESKNVFSLSRRGPFTTRNATGRERHSSDLPAVKKNLPFHAVDGFLAREDAWRWAAGVQRIPKFSSQDYSGFGCRRECLVRWDRKYFAPQSACLTMSLCLAFLVLRHLLNILRRKSTE